MPSSPPLLPPERRGPIFETPTFRDTKDPCPVFDGSRWHLFGSGGSSHLEVWQILHATAPRLEGPWTEQPPSVLHGVKGDHVAAPGVVHDGTVLHMFVQTDHTALDTAVEHLVSDDDGSSFWFVDRAIGSMPGTGESGVYDPHPAVIGGQHLLVYSGHAVVGRPDLYLARSSTSTWGGPWERLGVILTHEEVEHHNQRHHSDYEWGLEGGQLIELPEGDVLLNAVCFLPDQPRGRRQRVFFAAACRPTGPYRSLGPVLLPDGAEEWESGENGHATALVHDGHLALFYQGRSWRADAQWRYGVAVWELAALQRAANTVLGDER